MSRKALLALAALALVACASKPAVAPVFAEPAPGVTGVASAATASQGPRQPALSAEVLPSITQTATLKVESLLLQRPQRGSAVLKTLPSGTVTTLLGDLSNAEGEWLSVAVDGQQGWIRGDQATR